MQERSRLLPDEATDKLLGQFERTPETLEQLMATGLSLDEAVCEITELIASGFYQPLPTDTVPYAPRGREIEYLARWHSSVRADCSAKFESLKDQNPTTPKEELNQVRELQLLNGIRRGVHRAMVRSQGLGQLTIRYTS